MTAQHTPGPWVAVARTNAHIEIEAPNQFGYLAKKVASCSLTNHEANARLIAAAPELLEALQAIVQSWDNNTFDRERYVTSDLGDYWTPAKAMVNSETIAAARAAIQKATNKEQPSAHTRKETEHDRCSSR